LLLAVGTTAGAPEKVLKIGVVHDPTGPFAGGGSALHYDGAKIMIDWFNAHGGIDGVIRLSP
jgi:ABC-type branched-subunit amino acid transport system substrate-binding protein